MAQLRDLIVTGAARFVNGAYFGGASTFGSATRPIWWNNGFPQATTYSLSATLNAGSANRLAYYSGANAVSASSHYASATQVGINITNVDTIGSRALYVNGVSEFSDDIYANKSIRNLAVGGGLYWNPYVESATDSSDAASITLIKSGIAGGTELQIKQANDQNDVINLVAPYYIYLNSKRAFTVNDSWLRINDTSTFTSGIYTGTSILRTDNQLQVGNNGANFYVKNTGDAFIQKTLGIGGTDIGYTLYVKGKTRFDNLLHFENGTGYTELTTESRRSKNSDNADIETITGLVTQNKSFIEIRGFAPPTMIRTTHDRPAPYGLGFGNGSESAGIMPVGEADKLQELMFYGANTGPTLFTWKYQLWETNTYDTSSSNGYSAAMMSLNSKTGDLYVKNTIGINGTNTTYKLYVNGTSYFNGDTKATKFIGPLQGNADTATRLTVSEGTIYHPIYFTNGQPATINYIATHPEGDGIVIPFSIGNDLSNLYKRGGSVVIYETSDTSFAAATLTNTKTLVSNDDKLFDGTPNYVGFTLSATSATVIIDIKGISYHHSTHAWIDFGAAGWGSTSVEWYILEKGTTAYKKITTGSRPCHQASIGNGATGFDAIRLVLKGWSTVNARIAQIGLLNYTSLGLRNSFMSTGFDDKIYRSITPAINNSYSLGGSSNKWANVYATTFHGALVGNSTSTDTLRESQQNKVVMTTFLDNVANIHRSSTQGELNLYRFFASGDEANYSASYGYPAVDNHVLVFSIDTNLSTWERVIDLDIRSANIYTRAKTNGTWGPWVTLLSSENYTGILDSRYMFKSDLGNTTFKVTRGTSMSTATGGYWAAMVNSTQAGSPTCPTSGWWHVISMDWSGNDPNNWISQLALPTADCGTKNVYFRYNNSNGTSIDSGTWRMLWKQGDAVTSAVWNDYAECRKSDSQEPGYVMFEKGDDSLSKTIERLQHFAGIVSDTWGFSQGETADAKTNIAVAGRVLAYPYRDRNEYKPGDCVCAAPGGKVDIMTREEIVQYPDRIVGTVSCVPEYETWGGGELADRDPVKVNGRIWIKVK